jgi:hypothetical protein
MHMPKLTTVLLFNILGNGAKSRSNVRYFNVVSSCGQLYTNVHNVGITQAFYKFCMILYKFCEFCGITHYRISICPALHPFLTLFFSRDGQLTETYHIKIK